MDQVNQTTRQSLAWRVLGAVICLVFAGIDVERLLRGDGDVYIGSSLLLSAFCLTLAISGCLKIWRLANGR